MPSSKRSSQPRDLPNPGIKPASLMAPDLAGNIMPPGRPDMAPPKWVQAPEPGATHQTKSKTGTWPQVSAERYTELTDTPKHTS